MPKRKNYKWAKHGRVRLRPRPRRRRTRWLVHELRAAGRDSAGPRRVPAGVHLSNRQLLLRILELLEADLDPERRTFLFDPKDFEWRG